MRKKSEQIFYDNIFNLSHVQTVCTRNIIQSGIQLVETLFSIDDLRKDKSAYCVEQTIFVAITGYNRGKLNGTPSEVQASTREHTFHDTRACTTDMTPFARLLS